MFKRLFLEVWPYLYYSCDKPRMSLASQVSNEEQFGLRSEL